MAKQREQKTATGLVRITFRELDVFERAGLPYEFAGHRPMAKQVYAHAVRLEAGPPAFRALVALRALYQAGFAASVASANEVDTQQRAYGRPAFWSLFGLHDFGARDAARRPESGEPTP